MSNRDELQAQLDGMFESMNADFAAIFKAYDADEQYEDQDARDVLAESGYGASIKTLVRLTLAGGGPSAWLDVICDKSRYGTLEVESVTFHATWFGQTPVSRELREDDALYRWAEFQTEYMDAGE